MDLQQTFKQPGSEYRGKPFWAWNGKLEPEELRRQIRVFQQMGLGGFFMHSRVGLDTPYLGETWFDCVAACIDEAQKTGQTAWMYDEDRWPSGAAGGLVTKKPSNRMRRLTMRALRPEQFALGSDDRRGLLGVWEARLEGGVATDVRALAPGQKPTRGAGRRVLTFQVEETELNPWYNGYTYLDTLSEAAVKDFIASTHDAYARRFGPQFGATVPGMFTDEPNYGHHWGELGVAAGELAAALPWTAKLPQEFKARYGYDLRKHLPELFFDIEGEKIARARYHYRDCVTHLFVKNFAGQIGAWCEKNGLLFTGHVLFEQPLGNQVWVVGAAMRFYEKMQAPGIDVLTQFYQEYDTAKACASVLRQTGRKWMLSELYGCTGWDFPFEGHKAVGDWQAALGVNLRCQHLAWYTMAGEAKRDYPASISFQSPWWRHYRVVEDYFARVGLLLSQGEPVRRLLVIHPVESMWLRLRPSLAQPGKVAPHDGPGDPDGLGEQMVALRNWLLEARLDFDYGDEEMLSRLGAVRRGARAAVFQVGQAEYDMVLVPPLLTVRASTLKLLERFRAAGGRVVFAGELPEAVDAAPSLEAARVAERCECVLLNRAALVAAVEDAVRDVSVKDARGREVTPVLAMLRRDGARRILFLCNTDRRHGLGEVTVSLRAQGSPSEWDLMSGEAFVLDAEHDGAWLRFKTELPASGSRLFVVDPKPHKGLPPKPRWSGERREALKAAPGVQLSEANVLVLDRPAYRIGRQKQRGPLEILKVDAAARDSLGVAHRGGAMVQPWARQAQESPPSVPLELRYAIAIDELPGGPLSLYLETPERFEIRLNGAELRHEEGDGWWADPCLKQVRIDPALLVQGENELTLTIDFRESDNLEAAFLAGDFGVRVEGAECRITRPVRALKPGDWTAQGLPFYSGAVTYRFKAQPRPVAGEHVFFAAPDFKGALARVLVGGREAGFLPWPPYELDLTAWLAGAGEAIEIGLEVFGSRRNAFGPLHLADPNPPWTGPAEFVSKGEAWREAYQLKPCGLMRPPALVYRQLRHA